MTYLVDTDWIIDAIGGVPTAVILMNQLSVDGLAVSIVTVGEVYEGAFHLSESELMLATFRDFLVTYDILPLTDSIVERFARLRAALRRRGQLIPDLDLLIAATAIDEHLILVTRNLRHFDRIGELDIYEAT